jgi:CRISPR system Cascade subunit CasD
MMTKFLLLWLEAPLQSWGADSKFGRRDSLPFPTKSGIAGLLLCALGASGAQRELLGELALLKQTAVSYVRRKQVGEDSEKIVREPLLRDFHMVGSGYEDGNRWERMHIPKTKDGKPAVGGGTKLTYRYYLQDAKFAVILEVPSSRSETFIAALQNPVYDIYLGRKNCAPTDFVYRGVYDAEQDALEKVAEIAKSKNELVEDFRVVDGEREEGDTIILNDIPVQFGEVKVYRDRRVTVTVCE